MLLTKPQAETSNSTWWVSGEARDIYYFCAQAIPREEERRPELMGLLLVLDSISLAFARCER